MPQPFRHQPFHQPQQQQQVDEPADTTVLRMRGLPFNSTREDISGFFSGFSITQIVAIPPPLHGRPRGEACVEFSSQDECARAIIVKQHQLMGSRYIELFYATQEELLQALEAGGGEEGALSGQVEQGMSQTTNGNPAHHLTVPGRLLDLVKQWGQDKCVLIRGLPFSATTADLRNFFAGYAVAVAAGMPHGSVAIEDGRGEGLAAFETREEAERATSELHKQYLGTRWLDLKFLG